ncbi:hypothetical protein AXG93_4225s1500 [Marchantia polymorpha subsp. ruderalis]|uniref:Uncharacterized protein n=1 Tax=Marchantia polymorpha subsp. ruderalis TaxID=1480154 RepID=A0A176WTJ8_MARPO|nr:hypothetical protein AXG93_4225s1500 [Marchantia polymorpha subsp. ruderalis]
MGVEYISFNHGQEQSFNWHPAVEPHGFVLPLQVVDVERNDMLASSETDAQPYKAVTSGCAILISYVTSSSRLNYDGLARENGS